MSWLGKHRPVQKTLTQLVSWGEGSKHRFLHWSIQKEKSHKVILLSCLLTQTTGSRFLKTLPTTDTEVGFHFLWCSDMLPFPYIRELHLHAFSTGFFFSGISFVSFSPLVYKSVPSLLSFICIKWNSFKLFFYKIPEAAALFLLPIFHIHGIWKEVWCRAIKMC